MLSVSFYHCSGVGGIYIDLVIGRYHGCLCRQDAEALLTDDGDFLVRESASQPGDFALTCRWNSNNVHFMINKV